MKIAKKTLNVKLVQARDYSALKVNVRARKLTEKLLKVENCRKIDVFGDKHKKVSDCSSRHQMKVCVQDICHCNHSHVQSCQIPETFTTNNVALQFSTCFCCLKCCDVTSEKIFFEKCSKIKHIFKLLNLRREKARNCKIWEPSEEPSSPVSWIQSFFLSFV